MFEFRLGCRFASVALCLSNLHLSSNPSSFSSLFLTSAKENLTLDLARKSLVPRTILSPYKSSAAGRRAKERHATSRTFPRVLCHRLASLRIRYSRTFVCLAVWKNVRFIFHLYLIFRIKFRRVRREMLIHRPRHIRIDETWRNFTIHPTLRRLESI